MKFKLDENLSIFGTGYWYNEDYTYGIIKPKDKNEYILFRFPNGHPPVELGKYNTIREIEWWMNTYGDIWLEE